MSQRYPSELTGSAEAGCIPAENNLFARWQVQFALRHRASVAARKSRAGEFSGSRRAATLLREHRNTGLGRGRVITRLRNLEEKLNAGYWFVPSLMTISAVAAAGGMLAVDRRLAQAEPGWWSDWLEGNSAEGAREILTTIASSMINVTGVVFSLTIVALTVATSQFGPRLLRNFMRDRGNQAVLGTFLATFAYSIVVLRTVGLREEEGSHVPHASLGVALVLAFVSLGVLIYFIHHVAESLQVSSVIERAGSDLDASIEEMFPAEVGTSGPEPEQSERGGAEPGDEIVTVEGQCGYIQAIAAETLIEAAEAKDVWLELRADPGDYVVADTPLLTVRPSGRLDEHTRRILHSAFITGPQRTQEQDIEFPVDQLVELAVRALSPAMNDPFTAINCIDRLTSSLVRLVRRPLPSPVRFGPTGAVRLLAHPRQFPQTLPRAFRQILLHGRENPIIPLHLTKSLVEIARRAQRGEDFAALEREAARCRRLVDQQAYDCTDRASIDQRLRELDALFSARAHPAERSAGFEQGPWPPEQPGIKT